MLRNNIFLLLLIILISFFLHGCAAVDQVKQSTVASVSKLQADNAYNRKDFKTASNAYLKSAELGNSRSQFIIGSMYLGGEGVSYNQKKGVMWIKKSAENGYPLALYNAGFFHLVGFGVNPNPNTAVPYFEKAAKKNHDLSMYMLGLMYAAGNGVQQSDTEALAWFRRAKAQGFPVKPQLLSKSSIRSYVEQKSQSNAKTQKQKLAQQKLVRETQKTLTQLGYSPGPIDGMYGGKTRTAIQAFQQKYGMPPDGLASAETLKKMKAFLK